MEDKNLQEKSWEEFRATGLILFVNEFLHLFGWALTSEINEDGSVKRVYPARCKYRGFDSKAIDAAYKKVTAYLKQNVDELEKDCQD